MKTECHNPRRSRAAYTLMEVMMGVLVLGFLGISLFSAFTLGFLIIRTSREDLRATQILSEKIEAIRLCTWSELANIPTTFTDDYEPSQTNTGGTVYYGTIASSVPTNLPAAYDNNMRLLTVSVTWTNYLGSTSFVHTRTMQTESAYYGIQNYIWGSHP
jgi:type II secretory pathway pseudopilin PulG